MIDLQLYEDYLNDLIERVPGINGILPLTIDEDMGKQIQSLDSKHLPILFVIIPSSTGNSPDVDNIHENNLCVVFLMAKYDNQRKKAYQVIKELQPTVELLKKTIIEDSATGCDVMARIDLGSISTIPESGFYNNLAGWSIGFTLDSQ